MVGVLLLALVQGCGAEPVAATAPPRRVRAPAGPTRAAVGEPTERQRLLEACVAGRLRGPGYDDLAARDTRRKLRRLQARAECEQQP